MFSSSYDDVGLGGDLGIVVDSLMVVDFNIYDRVFDKEVERIKGMKSRDGDGGMMIYYMRFNDFEEKKEGFWGLFNKIV